MRPSPGVGNLYSENGLEVTFVMTLQNCKSYMPTSGLVTRESELKWVMGLNFTLICYYSII